MKKIFETKIMRIGPLATGFIKENKMIVLFGEEVPAALADFCFIIKVKEVIDQIIPDGIVKIDQQAFKITAVGDLVKQNLENLGHITINLNGAKVAELPGTLHVEAQESPEIKEGSILEISNP